MCFCTCTLRVRSSFSLLLFRLFPFSYFLFCANLSDEFRFLFTYSLDIYFPLTSSRSSQYHRYLSCFYIFFFYLLSFPFVFSTRAQTQLLSLNRKRDERKKKPLRKKQKFKKTSRLKALLPFVVTKSFQLKKRKSSVSRHFRTALC